VNLGSLSLNPGSQTDFVLGDEKYSAFLGGLGSGKTYAGLIRGLKYALQPVPKGVHHPPVGVVAAVSYPALRDIIVPKLEEIMARTGLADMSKDYRKQEMELTLRNGAKIRLRSLDKPDNIIRGPEYCWAFIDEGRNVSLKDWKLLTGRLRQPGYEYAAFVASTPNGYDWMYNVFHPKGELRSEYPNASWYNAPMAENIHLPPDYVAEMEVSYSGRWYEQEVLGQFVGLVEGGVFPEWDPDKFCIPLDFDPKLPLYTGWDFGIGDPGVCIFLQVAWNPVEITPGVGKFFPEIRVIDFLEAKDLSSGDWARLYKDHLEGWFPPGTKTRQNYGDPAGAGRRVGVTTSVIDDLRSAGVPIIPATKRSPDYAIRILSNMMAGGRVYVNKMNAERVSHALATHKWNLDKDGVRVGSSPVHDWTSHIVDALRYAVAQIPLQSRSAEPEEEEQPGPMTYGHVFGQLTAATGPRAKRRPDFVAPTIRQR
jgi:hypothetical protein